MNADYSYEIITTYFSIEEKNGDSIQLNLISWNHQEPKYDLRRWRSGKPLKGMSLAEDTLKAICEAMVKITIEAPKKEEKENAQDKTAEDAEKPSVKRNILREKVLSIVSKPEYFESQLRIEDVIGEQALVNYLLRNNISSLSDLAQGICDGSMKLTSNKEIKVYKALIEFDEKSPDEILGEDRQLFLEINEAYDALPISVIAPFLDVKESKKAASRLLAGGYDTIGKLEGALESSLERIVGRNKSYIFIEAERALALEPEQIIAEMWEKKADSRAITLILERSKGRSFKEIADGEGLSRERIRQMIFAFYAGQDHFLQMIKEKISGSTDKIATLQNLFPKDNHRILFVNWVRMIAHSEELEFDEVVEKDKMSFKDIKDYYQLSLFDL
ncbi:hypothetical protein [Butyrivibrio fibrisolvens]|uniref:hypothetical protein n=1 Tax=Butyrivibrio fibrisolvens TaxID=831 RepID=UPI000410AEC4|nr:hypothetical protein [Butyrivibrio fibrisolvens]